MSDFCSACGTVLNRNVFGNGQLVYKCPSCGQSYPGTANQTLISIVPARENSNPVQYQDFINHASHDPAGYKVAKRCPNDDCGLDFLTLTRFPPNEIIMYTCLCGYSAPSAQYDKDIQSKKM